MSRTDKNGSEGESGWRKNARALQAKVSMRAKDKGRDKVGRESNGRERQTRTVGKASGTNNWPNRNKKLEDYFGPKWAGRNHSLHQQATGATVNCSQPRLMENNNLASIESHQ